MFLYSTIAVLVLAIITMGWLWYSQIQNSKLPVPRSYEELKETYSDKYHTLIDEIHQKENAYDVSTLLLDKITSLEEQNHTLDSTVKDAEVLHYKINDELQIKNDEITSISHQIRTSLSGLIAFTDFLKHTEMSGEQDEFCSAIDESAQELLSIANNMSAVEHISPKQYIRHDVPQNVRRQTKITENITEKVKEISQDKSVSEVLVVDDNLINRKLMQHVLGNFDVNVTFAENGQEAVNLREDNDFDIIFMDIEMPVMNGVEASIAIRKFEKVYDKNQVYIVAVTGQYEEKIYMDAGMNDYIPKPIVPEDIKRRLDKV